MNLKSAKFYLKEYLGLKDYKVKIGICKIRFSFYNTFVKICSCQIALSARRDE